MSNSRDEETPALVFSFHGLIEAHKCPQLDFCWNPSGPQVLATSFPPIPKLTPRLIPPLPELQTQTVTVLSTSTLLSVKCVSLWQLNKPKYLWPFTEMVGRDEGGGVSSHASHAMSRPACAQKPLL